MMNTLVSSKKKMSMHYFLYSCLKHRLWKLVRTIVKKYTFFYFVLDLDVSGGQLVLSEFFIGGEGGEGRQISWGQISRDPQHYIQRLPTTYVLVVK